VSAYSVSTAFAFFSSAANATTATPGYVQNEVSHRC